MKLILGSLLIVGHEQGSSGVASQASPTNISTPRSCLDGLIWLSQEALLDFTSPADFASGLQAVRQPHASHASGM